MTIRTILIICTVLFSSSSALSNELVIDGNTIKEVSTTTTTLWQAEMTEEMMLLPVNCVQEAYQKGKAICKSLVSSVEFGIPTIITKKVSSASFNKAKGKFELESTLVSSNSWLTFIFLFITPFICISLMNALSGYKKTSRKGLIVFEVVVMLCVLICSITNIIVGMFVSIFITTIIVVLVNSFVNEIYCTYAAELAGVFAIVTIPCVIVTMLTGIISSNGYSFLESIQRASIPEYLVFLVVTCVIGFVLREIAFWYVTRKAIAD